MAEPGDLIEITRGQFSHWALYVGNGYVIHVTGDASKEQAISGIGASLGLSKHVPATVKKDKLKNVAFGDKWTVNNLHDKTYEARSTDVIVKAAELLVGQVVPYELLSNNCEHFVTNLRYGIPESRQAQTAIGFTGVGIFASLGSSATTYSHRKEN